MSTKLLVNISDYYKNPISDPKIYEKDDTPIFYPIRENRDAVSNNSIFDNTPYCYPLIEERQFKVFAKNDAKFIDAIIGVYNIKDNSGENIKSKSISELDSQIVNSDVGENEFLNRDKLEAAERLLSSYSNLIATEDFFFKNYIIVPSKIIDTQQNVKFDIEQSGLNLIKSDSVHIENDTYFLPFWSSQGIFIKDTKGGVAVLRLDERCCGIIKCKVN